MDIQINHELLALLISYMERIEIIEPKSLRDQFKKNINTLGGIDKKVLSENFPDIFDSVFKELDYEISGK